MSRGFAAVGLWRPKFDGNIGATMRAAQVFDARLVAIIGADRPGRRGRIERTDPRASHRQVPLLFVDSLSAALPHECVPVAVEVLSEAEELPEFVHPERAFYVFGPEDGSLPRDALSECRRFVRVPGRGCLNLAMTANVVLYDRMAKAALSSGER